MDECDLTNIIDVDNTSEGEDESTIIHQEKDRVGTEPGEQTEASMTEDHTEASMTEEHEPRLSTRERRMPIRWIHTMGILRRTAEQGYVLRLKKSIYGF